MRAGGDRDRSAAWARADPDRSAPPATDVRGTNRDAGNEPDAASFFDSRAILSRLDLTFHAIRDALIMVIASRFRTGAGQGAHWRKAASIDTEYALYDLARPVGISCDVTRLVESLPPTLRGNLPSPEGAGDGTEEG